MARALALAMIVIVVVLGLSALIGRIGISFEGVGDGLADELAQRAALLPGQLDGTLVQLARQPDTHHRGLAVLGAERAHS
jgi:hypothetical protein